MVSQRDHLSPRSRQDQRVLTLSCKEQPCIKYGGYTGRRSLVLIKDALYGNNSDN
jgi:hypothetical protein